MFLKSNRIINIKFKRVVTSRREGGRGWDGEKLISICNLQAMILVLELEDGLTGVPLIIML